MTELPTPTEEQLASPHFEALWELMKGWDIQVDEEGRCGTTGSHIAAILDTIGPVVDEQIVLALGRVSSELAHRADAYNGNAPDWFPEPPEWLALWNDAMRWAGAEIERRRGAQ